MEQKKIPPDRPERPRELRSWKEIAHHLGVNVRTAQKWEKGRGLPIRRAYGVRGRVSAEAAALREWNDRSSKGEPREQRENAFVWPLAPDLRVELRFVGREVRAADVELLFRLLALLKRSYAN